MLLSSKNCYRRYRQLQRKVAIQCVLVGAPGSVPVALLRHESRIKWRIPSRALQDRRSTVTCSLDGADKPWIALGNAGGETAVLLTEGVRCVVFENNK